MCAHLASMARHVLATSDVVVSPPRLSEILSGKDAEGFGFGGTGKKSRPAEKWLSAVMLQLPGLDAHS